MPRRSDTRFGSIWIVRTIPAVLTVLALTGPATAQILGEQTPGTPGAIDGEFRPARPASAPPAPSATGLRGPDPDLAGSPASRRFGLRRNPNLAAKQQLGSGQARPGSTTSPAAGQIPRAGSPVSGRTASPARTTGSLAPAPRPGIMPPAGPGLPPPVIVTPRRPARENDPYAPLGIRAGSFILRPAIEISAGYDTNAARSATRARSSPVYRTEGELAARSDWSRHQLDVTLRGAYTGYTALQGVNRPEGDVRAALRLDATRDLTIEGGLTARIDTENPGNVNLPAGTQNRIPFYSFGTLLGATHRFGRLSLGLRGTLDRTLYSDIESGGLTTSQESRNLTVYGLRLRAGYEVTPGITPFAELGVDNRVHDLSPDTNGFRRDSRGLTLRVGSTVELARDLTGEVGAGYTFRHYEDARLAYLRAPVVDAALTWSASPLTTLNLRAQTEVVETTLANSAGGIAYRGTATLTHAFLRNFTATATLGIARIDYEGVNRAETTYNAGMRLEYKFNRLVALRGSYTFERLQVNAPGENYNAHTFLLGMRLTR